MSNDKHNAMLGNTVRDSGVDRCACGCKYWENDTCVDCGATEPEDVPCVACGRTDLPLHVSGRCPDCEPLWAVVASHDGHYDYVLADELTEADARESAAHEGAPFYAVPMDEVYRPGR